MRTFPHFKMAPTTSTEKSLALALFMEEVRVLQFTTNFSTEYRDKHKKKNCCEAIEEKLELSPDQAEKNGVREIFKEISAVLFWKKGGTSTALNLKNCANDVVRPRCPQYSLSDRSDYINMETTDRWR